MPIYDEDRIASDHPTTARSEDRILLDEANHRVANEVASALAAVHLARAAKGLKIRLRMLDRAIDRLEGFGDCCRILAAPPGRTADAGALLDQVCRALCRSRHSEGPAQVMLNLAGVVVPGEVARRIALVANELVTNALKHAFGRPGGVLEVRLEALADDLVLSVIDDGPGLGQGRASITGGGRLGGGIVGELVRGAGGSLECDSGPSGTAIHVSIPRRGPAGSVADELRG